MGSAYQQLTALGTREQPSSRLKTKRKPPNGPFSPVKHLLSPDLISHLRTSATRTVFSSQILSLVFEASLVWP